MMSSEVCEHCLQYLHYTRYLQSKIRVLETKLKERHLQQEQDSSSSSSSDSSSDERSANQNNRRVIEVQGPNWEDIRKIEINKVKLEAKRRKHN